MRLTVNGETREVNPDSTVADLLLDLDLGAGWVVVELNRSVVERRTYATTTLAEADIVEIVKAVAGG